MVIMNDHDYLSLNKKAPDPSKAFLATVQASDP